MENLAAVHAPRPGLNSSLVKILGLHHCQNICSQLKENLSNDIRVV
jgi:hypothetical protein